MAYPTSRSWLTWKQDCSPASLGLRPMPNQHTHKPQALPWASISSSAKWDEEPQQTFGSQGSDERECTLGTPSFRAPSALRAVTPGSAPLGSLGRRAEEKA